MNTLKDSTNEKHNKDNAKNEIKFTSIESPKIEDIHTEKYSGKEFGNNNLFENEIKKRINEIEEK